MQRYQSLDFLRGMAVLLVMCGHFLPGYLATHIGWSGVDLFFVLSGFFVSGILFREYKNTGAIRGFRFLLRRGFKIWPLFYTSILLYVIYYTVKGIPFSKAQLFTEIFFIQDYRQGFTVITWSLGIEEQFYLFLVLLMGVLLWTKKINWILPCCLALMATVLLTRVFHFYASPFVYDPYRYSFPLHLRADTLCAGIIISYYWNFHQQAFRDWVHRRAIGISFLLIILLSPVLFFSYQDPFLLTWGFSFVYLGYALLVCLLLVKERAFQSGRILQAIAWLGFYSYAIYLFHVFIGFGAAHFFETNIYPQAPLALNFAVFTGSDILFGYLASRLVEQPFLRLRDRFLPGDRP